MYDSWTVQFYGTYLNIVVVLYRFVETWSGSDIVFARILKAQTASCLQIWDNHHAKFQTLTSLLRKEKEQWTNKMITAKKKKNYLKHTRTQYPIRFIDNHIEKLRWQNSFFTYLLQRMFLLRATRYYGSNNFGSVLWLIYANNFIWIHEKPFDFRCHLNFKEKWLKCSNCFVVLFFFLCIYFLYLCFSVCQFRF